MINKTASKCELERLLLTSRAEYQTLKDEEKDVVIQGKSLARIYRQLIDVIEQLRAERMENIRLNKRCEWAESKVAELEHSNRISPSLQKAP